MLFRSHDDLAFLDYNRNQRRFDFVTLGKTLICNDYGQAPPNYNITQLYGTEFKLDLELEDYAGCGFTPAIHVAIIDPITLQPWETRDTLDVNGDTVNPTHNFNNANDFVNRCDINRNRPDKYLYSRPGMPCSSRE